MNLPVLGCLEDNITYFTKCDLNYLSTEYNEGFIFKCKLILHFKFSVSTFPVRCASISEDQDIKFIPFKFDLKLAALFI